jgi:deoxycytidine triphosphate deaminase
MIVGHDILLKKLIKGGLEANLKHSTFDLTIGEIIPIGKEGIQARRKPEGISSYIIEPREMVWILSAEEFSMPNDVTGIATLRTSFTQQGMLALNVGIIDPFFEGPISTALLNFSDVPREIKVGTAFFRVIFVEHADVSGFHKKNESRRRADYIKSLEKQSLQRLFPQNFLNIPKLDDEFYSTIFGKLVFAWLKNNMVKSIVGFIVLACVFYYMWQDGLGTIVIDVFTKIRNFVSSFKPT